MLRPLENKTEILIFLLFIPCCDEIKCICSITFGVIQIKAQGQAYLHPERKKIKTNQREVLKKSNVFFLSVNDILLSSTEQEFILHTIFFLKKYTVSQQQHMYYGVLKLLSLFSLYFFSLRVNKLLEQHRVLHLTSLQLFHFHFHPKRF